MTGLPSNVNQWTVWGHNQAGWVLCHPDRVPDEDLARLIDTIINLAGPSSDRIHAERFVWTGHPEIEDCYERETVTWERTPCEPCDGTGEKWFDLGQQCNDCDGAGHVWTKS